MNQDPPHSSAIEVHRQLLLVREEEQRRIAEELHESICQDIVVLQMKLSSIGKSLGALSPDQLHEMLQDSSGLCKDLLNRTRSICYALYPTILDNLGLVPALEGLQERGIRAGVDFDLRTVGTARRLPRMVEIALYRVAQEATTNALRHAQPRSIVIVLEFGPSHVRLEVSDDGGGFDVPKIKPGLGITVMRERMLAVNGVLHLASSAGRTVITATAPDAPDTTVCKPL